MRRKKAIQGGASEDVQTTKVSPISSRHRVLQSMLSEYIKSDKDDLNEVKLRPELLRKKVCACQEITVHTTRHMNQ